ncbi:uncharacterized protein LOC134437271 [Engraulis encrasicolus]|uniref:uncharacterized protein LOC134437271 n=1 Tax=Engraulis encrasicolus TaxID=184585 RepID=UPI002FD03DA4
MEDDGQEERQPSGCFMTALGSMVTTVRDSIRRRRVRKRHKNNHIPKMHVEKEEAGGEKPTVKKRKRRWVINPFRRRRPKDREAAAAAKTIEESSIEECRTEEVIKAPQVTEATEVTEGKEEDVTSESLAEAADLQAEACPTATDHDANDDADDDDIDDGVATATEETRRCCEDVVQSTLLGFDIPEGLITHQTLRHVRETDESNAWDLFVLLSLAVFLGVITFYFFVSLFKIITEDV